MDKSSTVGRLTLLISAMALAGTAGTTLLGQSQPSAPKPPAYAKDSPALLIVDPYNDFMSEGGKMYKQTLETATEVGFYENMRKLIPA